MNHLESLRRRSGTSGRKSPDAITVKYTAHANDDDDNDHDMVSGLTTSATPSIQVSVPSKLAPVNNTVSSLPTVAVVNPVATVIEAIHNSDVATSEIVGRNSVGHENLSESVISSSVDASGGPEVVVIDVDNIGFDKHAAGGSSADPDTLSINSATSGISARESVTSHGSNGGSSGKRKWLSNLKQKIEHKFEKIEHKIEEKIDNYKSDKNGSSTAFSANSAPSEKVSVNGSRGMSRSPSDLSTDTKKYLGRIYEDDDLNDDAEADIALHATSSALESERLLGNLSSTTNPFSFASTSKSGRKAASRFPGGESESTGMPPSVKYLPKVDRNMIKVQTDLLQRCLNPADDYESDPNELPLNGVTSADGRKISAVGSNADVSGLRKMCESRLSTTASSASLIQRGGLRSTSIAYDPTIRGRQGAKPPKSIQFETIVEGVQKKIRRERHFQAKEDPAEVKKRAKAKRNSKSKRGRGKDGLGETASDTNSADEASGSKDSLKGGIGSRQSITSLVKGHAMSRSLPSLAELPSSSDTEQPAVGSGTAATAAADSQSRTSADDVESNVAGGRDVAVGSTSTTDILSNVPDFSGLQSTIRRYAANTPFEAVLEMWPISLIMQHSSTWIYVCLLGVFSASWFSASSWNFLSGFFLGLLSAGFVVYKLMKPLAELLNVHLAPAPPAPTMSTTQAVNFASELIVQRRDNTVADKKVYEAWMLEFTGEYKAEDFVISDTRLIFIRVDGPILRIQRPKHEYLAPKIALDEKLPKAPTFVHQRIIDLDRSRVMLHPEKLSNSQRWNRKYPIVIVTQQMTSSKTVSKQRNVKASGSNTNNNDAATRVSSATSEKKQDISSSSPKTSSPQQRRASVAPSLMSTAVGGGVDTTTADLIKSTSSKDLQEPQEERILLFARTNRQKEQWYWLLRRAAKQDGPEMALIPDIRLFQSPNFTPLNALIHRLFADALTEKAWHDVVEFIIEDKLSKVALPTWIGDFKMSQLQLGKRIPLLSDVCDKPVYNEMGLWLDVWFEYHGGLTFRLETKLNLMELKRSSSPPARKSQSKNDENGGNDLPPSYAAAADDAASIGGPSATSADSMLNSPTSPTMTEHPFGREFGEIDPFSIDADGNLCENVADGADLDVYSDAPLNIPYSSSMPLGSSYRKRFNSDAGGSSATNRHEVLSPMSGAAKAFDTVSMASSTASGGTSNGSKPNMTITTTTTSTGGTAKSQTGTEGAAEMKRNKFLRFVDKIAQSKYFQSATENKYIKKAMEGVSKTPLTLQVELQRVSGRLQINIPPPPSDKLWWGFAPTPHIDLNARPFYGEKEVKTTQVIAWLEKRLVSEINKLVTSPNFDDVTIPFMNNHIHTYEQRLSKLKDVFL